MALAALIADHETSVTSPIYMRTHEKRRLLSDTSYEISGSKESAPPQGFLLVYYFVNRYTRNHKGQPNTVNDCVNLSNRRSALSDKSPKYYGRSNLCAQTTQKNYLRVLSIEGQSAPSEWRRLDCKSVLADLYVVGKRKYSSGGSLSYLSMHVHIFIHLKRTSNSSEFHKGKRSLSARVIRCEKLYP